MSEVLPGQSAVRVFLQVFTRTAQMATENSTWASPHERMLLTLEDAVKNCREQPLLGPLKVWALSCGTLVFLGSFLISASFANWLPILLGSTPFMNLPQTAAVSSAVALYAHSWILTSSDYPRTWFDFLDTRVLEAATLAKASKAYESMRENWQHCGYLSTANVQEWLEAERLFNKAERATKTS